MKLCALICTVIATSALCAANSSEVVKSASQPSPFTDGGTSYNLVCPLFSILDFGDGFLEFVNCYPNNCNDIPVQGYGIFSPEPFPCDCPENIDGCVKGPGYFSIYDRMKPLPTKVPADGAIPGLNKKIVLSKSVPGYFVQNDEPVYVRLLNMVYFDKDVPQKCRSFTLGLEMKSPLTGIEGLTEIKDVKPTNLPFLYTIQQQNQTILIVRAEGVTHGKEKQPKLATPSSDQK
jgi:hypothetical protein